MKKIVLVDDDQSIRDDEAEVPSLFILDKNISGTNGLDICRYIKSNEKFGHVPVIMLSASPNIEELAREAAADDTIVKPFS